MQIQRISALAIAGLNLGPSLAAAPAIETFTIDGGGATSSGDGWSITGTIGQADAGPALVGGSLALEPGFWPILAADRYCPADVAAPFGVLDLADINAFAGGFLTGDLIADLAEPCGVLDLNDINVFVTSFLAGCP